MKDESYYREQADSVQEDEYWTQGLDVAVEGAPVVHRDLRGELNIKIQGVPSSWRHHGLLGSNRGRRFIHRCRETRG